eukprot:8146221-Pyramimonas_sp.AAC.1
MLTFVHWNCMRADELRLNDISEELATIDLIALTSTGERASQDQATTRSSLRYHYAIHSGYVPSRHSNRSCGTVLLIRKSKFRMKHLVDTPAVPKYLRGR